MLISRKGRYSVRAMTTLACLQRTNDMSPVKLSLIASKENLPLYYIEQLFNKLRKGGVVKSVKGPGGGYTLARNEEEITLLDILYCVGETVHETECEKSAKKNNDCQSCPSRYIWDNLDLKVKEYLRGINITELVEKRNTSGRVL